MTKSKMLNTKDACKYLNIKSRKTYLKYIKAGWISATLDGNKWMVEVEELNRFLKEGRPPIDVKALQAKPIVKKAPNTNPMKRQEKPYSYDPQVVFDSFKSIDLSLPPAKNMSLDEYKCLIVKKIKNLPHIREEHTSIIEDYARECVIVESISRLMEIKRDSVLLGDNPGQDENSYLFKDYESALARKIKLADELLLTPQSQAKLHPQIWEKLFIYSEIEIAKHIYTFLLFVVENDEVLKVPFSERKNLLFDRIEEIIGLFDDSKMSFEDWKSEEWPKIKRWMFSKEEK